MTRVARRWRCTVVALPLASAVIALAACGVPSVSSGSAQAAGPGTTGAPPTTKQTNPTTSPPVVRSSVVRQSPAQPKSGGRCAAGQLLLTVAQSDNSAGHIGLFVVFTNNSDRTCTMFGYPGVSFVTGPAGTQVNDPAERSGAPAASLVTLPPNARAHASLLLVNVDNYNGSPSCQPTLAAGIRVYPPDDTTALFARYPEWICDVKGTGVPEIYPVQAGANSL
jgi:hypothetical protein